MYNRDEHSWQDTNHKLGMMEKIYWNLANGIIDNDKVIYYLSFLFLIRNVYEDFWQHYPTNKNIKKIVLQIRKNEYFMSPLHNKKIIRQ